MRTGAAVVVLLFIVIATSVCTVMLMFHLVRAKPAMKGSQRIRRGTRGIGNISNDSRDEIGSPGRLEILAPVLATHVLGSVVDVAIEPNMTLATLRHRVAESIENRTGSFDVTVLEMVLVQNRSSAILHEDLQTVERLGLLSNTSDGHLQVAVWRAPRSVFMQVDIQRSDGLLICHIIPFDVLPTHTSHDVYNRANAIIREWIVNGFVRDPQLHSIEIRGEFEKTDGMVVQSVSILDNAQTLDELVFMRHKSSKFTNFVVNVTSATWDWLTAREWSDPHTPQRVVHALRNVTNMSGVFAQDGENCAICLSSMNVSDSLVTGRCSHVFHASCVEAWLCMRETCPTCRAPMR